MESGLKKKRKFKDKLKDTYRILVIDVEDLKEVGNYQLSMARFYMIIIFSVLIFSILLVSFIAFTPLKRLMPGYGKIEDNSKFLELRNKLAGLEADLEDQITYTQGLQNMLSGQTSEELAATKDKEPEPLNQEKTSVMVSDEDLEENKVTRSLNNQYFVPPILGTVSANFDRSKNHFGVDIIAPKGTAIKAIAGGVVIGSDFTMDAGNTISIQHPNNLVSVYKHNSALLKKTGSKVSLGEAIAIIGNTGELTNGPHLHFELWYDGNPVNPENFINFK